MSFGEHLDELRRRLVWALVGVVPVFLLGMYFGRDIMEFLIRPAQEQLLAQGQDPRFQATGAVEVFGTWMRISVIFTLLVASPWIILQAWLFVSPGLYPHERRFVYLLIPFSVLLTVLSALFLYFVMLPVVLHFLINFGSTVGAIEQPPGGPLGALVLPTVPVLGADPPAPEAGQFWINSTLHELRFCIASGPPLTVLSVALTKASGIVQQYRVSEYVGLILAMALAFAGGFQTPVVVLLLGWVGLVDYRWLAKQRRYAMFIAVVASAVLTPTGDPVTLLLLLVPLYALYELGVFMLRFLPASRVAGGIGKGRERDGAADE
jgi:sec-independent protein translocase protein TatC